MKDPERLAQSLLDSVVDVFDAARCCVLLERAGNVKVVASMGIPEEVATGAQLEYSSGIMRMFEERASLIDRDSPRTDTRAAREMQVLGARLGAPLLCHGRACGAILIGDKSSSRGYALEEWELLSTIARCASISIENARYYENVKQEQNRLDTLLGSITAGVIVVDNQRRISMMNTSGAHILGVRSQDLIGRSVQKLGSAFADVVLRTMSDGRARLRQEVRDAAINAKLGLSATPLDDSGVVVVFSRIPEDTESGEDVAYSPFWEYLASRVAQEVKNPMVAINTFAQLLPRKFQSEDFREAFSEVVQKEIARINGVVDTLNEFAQRPRLMLQRSDINETVRSVLKSFEEELAARHIDLQAEWEPHLLEAELDPIFFSQAVHNVLQNSIEAMPEGGKLKICTRRREDGCEVTIADTGPGISNQDAQNIFMPFYSTKEKGMGLGLTVAVRILRQHEGDLTLSTGDEGGSVFALRVPFAGESHANHSSN